MICIIYIQFTLLIVILVTDIDTLSVMECDPQPEAEAASGDKRRLVQRLIERYYKQLTQGCGRQGCDTPACASSGLPSLSPNEAAARSLQCLSVMTWNNLEQFVLSFRS